MENVGFQVRSLRQCPLDQQSLLPGRGLKKPSIRGLFVEDLWAGLDTERAETLSLSPFLSKADDSPISVRFL
jgi:hypothetical protein